MHIVQTDLTRILGSFGVIAIAASLSVPAAFSQQSAALRTTLQLEKPVYTIDESIRFWIGVSSETKIPEALRSSCVMHWVRPDGTRLDDPVSWPIDGDPSSGWSGGWGFGRQTPSLGRYVVSFECGGNKTAEQTFEVVPNPLFGIEARWIFVNAPSDGKPHAPNAVLHVENKTGRGLRFAKPGLVGSEVSMNVKTTLLNASTFVPQSALLQRDEVPTFLLFKLDWANESKWPMIVVPPDGSVDRPLSLDSSYGFRDGQQYDVALGTVLTIFVGERDDPDAQLFPLRMPVSGMVHFGL